MRALVVGGSGSGKSALAERLACSLGGRRTYVATMVPGTAEADARIARHRLQREGLGFLTVECTGPLPALGRLACDMACAKGQTPSVALLDDLGNLAANTLFGADGSMRDPDEVAWQLREEVMALAASYDHVVVVGNEAGCEGASRQGGTRAWVRLVGSLCCVLAERFDCVVEVACGIPLVVKGRLPEGEGAWAS